MDSVAIDEMFGEEMYGGSDGGSFHPWVNLLSMDGAIVSMDSKYHQWNATCMLAKPLR